MSEDVKNKVDADSAKFRQGVEAGLNSEEDTRNWKAGNELGQELRVESEGGGRVNEPAAEPDTPLFLRGGPDGYKGDAQDEKDSTGE